MNETYLRVDVDGEDVTRDLLDAGGQIEVEEALDEADGAVLTVGVEPDDAGEWTSVLDELAVPDTRLTISVEAADASFVFAGVVVSASWVLDADAVSQLTVKAVGLATTMDRVERVVPWPDIADSAIASTIFGSYGFATHVETTPRGADPDTFTPLQRGTDLAFLRSLARKWGFAAFVEVEGDKPTGHFRAIDPLVAPSVGLALGFGGDAERASVEVELDGGGSVLASRLPPLSDVAQTGLAPGDDQLEGDEPISVPRTLLLGPADVDGEIDPSAAAVGRAREGEFGVRLTVTTNLLRRGPLVRARRTVLVSGLGSRLSGIYLAERVRHRLSAEHHRQDVTLIRNAMGSSPLSIGGLR
jgi:hypothetical protein